MKIVRNSKEKKKVNECLFNALEICRSKININENLRGFFFLDGIHEINAEIINVRREFDRVRYDNVAFENLFFFSAIFTTTTTTDNRQFSFLSLFF